MKLWKGISMVLEEQAKLNTPKHISRVVEIPINQPTLPHVFTPSSRSVIHDLKKELETMPLNSGNDMQKIHEFKQSKVPSNPLSRIVQFTGLGMSVGLNSLSSYVKGENPLMNEKNFDLLAEKLCKMRGAALKLGQMLSIQDESMIPPEFTKIMDRVRKEAYIMPDKQLIQQLESELGPDWRDLFSRFDMIPFASASIGQVHYGELKNGEKVAIKVQFPGVAESIDSDIQNLKFIQDWIKIFPKGLYLDSLLAQMSIELKQECDYKREYENQVKMSNFLKHEPYIKVPKLYPDLCTRRVLTSEFVTGLDLKHLENHPSQKLRNHVSYQVLNLSLLELFKFRMMQTDPNWGNFLVDPETLQLILLDFGACLEFPPEFVEKYYQLVYYASVDWNPEKVLELSVQLKFLTGDENEIMKQFHLDTIKMIGQHFVPETYSFKGQKTTEKVQSNIPVMLKHRLTPPPIYSYSLHRKLSGAFLICMKLQSEIPCRNLLLKFKSDWLKANPK